MQNLFFSLFGATFTLGTAYALGRWAARRRATPFGIALAVGAVIESLLVFLLLLFGVAYTGAFIAIGVVAAIAAARVRLPRKGRAQACTEVAIPVFLAYGVWYGVNALAPEIAPDGITYHLGLAREYVRLAGFPDRITFYDVVPQGMEMLYTVAYALGRHAAAKLVEFGFFCASVPLILRIGQRLGLGRVAAAVPAVFFFCAPVAGLTGSTSYNDAAGVFFLLAALYLVMEDRLLEAGLCAGFCYAIKMPGILVPACGVAWFLIKRRPRAAAVLALGAAVAIAPWMIRNAVLTGNPLAPLANRVFPNPYFHIATETGLAEDLRSLGNVRPSMLPWELAFGDGLPGTYGPLLLALPIGLWALRRREGRLLWLGAVLLALPWLINSAARFLMPAIVIAGFALAMVLRRPAAFVAIGLQAVLCWPHVLDRIQPPYSFRVREFALMAAIGHESESDYLRRHIEEYDVARMIERSTPPDARTLALTGVANAWMDRDVVVWWQSAESDTMLDTLRLAGLYTGTPTFDWKVSWPAADVRALRFLIPKSYDGEWDIGEVQMFSGDAPIANSPQWTYTGRPNRWESPLALDGNMATRWRTWEPVRAGMHFDIDFGHAQRLTSAVLITHTPAFRVPLEVYGRDAKGEWRLLTKDAAPAPRPPQDLRLDASRALRRAGFRYLLVPSGSGGNAPIGNVMAGHEADWGMERAGVAGRYYLLRVK